MLSGNGGASSPWGCGAAGTSCVAPAHRGLFACYRDLGRLFQTQKGHKPPLLSNMKNFPKLSFNAKVLQVSQYFPREFF